MKRCKTFGATPKFLRFRLYKQCLHRSAFYKNWQTRLLLRELESRKLAARKFSSELADLEVSLKSIFSFFHHALVVRFFRNKVNKEISRVKTNHDRKLADLGIYNDLSPVNPEKTVLNFSSISLSPRLRTILAFGLDFGLPVTKLNFYQYFLKFEELYHNLCRDNIVESESCQEFKKQLQGIANKYFYNFKPYKIFSAIFCKSDISSLKALGRNKEVIVTRPDKGRGVVLLDRKTYVQKMDELISDRTKFSEIKESIQVYSLRVEDKINNFLRKLKNMSLLPDETYKKLYATGSGPGILYGLPKTHKANFASNYQLRPIFAAYNAASYKLAKFLVPVLAPFTTGEYTVDNSFTFCQKICSVENANHLFMTSFDIESLFTNIPLYETINICLNYLFPNDSSTTLGLSRKLFKTLLEHSVLNSFFLFNNRIFKQIEGLGMGLPLGPTFANIFMCYHEKLWLRECPDHFKPVFYTRYVDDTFVLFRDESHYKLFLNYINSKHVNINFTVETESSNSLSFLDVNVSRFNNKFITSVYRKPTFSGQGISFFSFTPFLFKLNAIKTLVFRSYSICSNYHDMHKEFNFLKDFFVSNGFPANLILSVIKHFLDRRINNTTITTTTTVPDEATEHIKYISLPFFGPQSEKLKNEILSLFNKYCSHFTIKVILSNNFKIGSFFNYKDKLPLCSRSSVVYKFNCSLCGTTYVGSTSRTLCLRTAEHKGISCRTGRPLTAPPHSAIRLHCEQVHDVPVKAENFSILDSTQNTVSLRILESLYIQKLKPELNDTNSAFPLNIV